MIRGVDACKGGWLSLSMSGDSSAVEARVFPAGARELLAVKATVTAIDVPIGLPAIGIRVADREARHLLGPRSSSVFSTPNRAVLGATDFEEACRRSQVARGTKLSRQTFGILPRIAAIDACLTADSALRNVVFEVHPELCFSEWNSRKPMRYGKKTGFGFLERLELVRSVFGVSPEMIREQFTAAAVADDDILDALAALWTARRIAERRAVRVPKKDERDGEGLPMVMWA